MNLLRFITRDQYNPIEMIAIMIAGCFIGSGQYLTPGALLTLGFVASLACRVIVKRNPERQP